MKRIAATITLTVTLFTTIVQAENALDALDKAEARRVAILGYKECARGYIEK